MGEVGMRRSGADAGDLGMNRIIVGAVGLIIGGAVGAHTIQLFHPSQHLRRSTATVRKTDNFAASTLGQIRADLRQYGVEENPQTYEVYQATGGIGAANPRIVSWGARETWPSRCRVQGKPTASRRWR